MTIHNLKFFDVINLFFKKEVFAMEEKRIKAQFSVTSISDDVPQLILNEDALVIKNESNVDITIPFSSINR